MSKTSPKSTASPRPHKVWLILSIIFSTLLITTTLTLGTMVVLINFLPPLYLYSTLIILGIITIVFIPLMLLKHIKLFIKIPLFFLSLLFSAIYLFAIIYLNQTFNFVNHLKGQDYLTESYYVVVMNSSPYQNITDLQDHTIATYDENQDIYDAAVAELHSLLPAQTQTVSSISELSSNLTGQITDAAFISSIHYDLLNELSLDNSTPFSEQTRIIHTIEVQVESHDDFTTNNLDLTTEPFVLYISGIDAYGDISTMKRGRSDVNMLATVNPKTHEILLISIPRDYYVQLHNTTGPKDKLTHAGIYGIQMSVTTLEDVLDIPINYYLKVNFSTVVNLVDTLDGIEVYSDQSFTPWTNRNLTISKGNIHMDGATALAFARERKAYSTGDRHRVQNQQAVISALISKISHSPIILTKYSEILQDISNSLETNLHHDEISALIRLQLQDMPNWQIYKYNLEGEDAHDYTYSMGHQLLYVMAPDFATVDKAHNLITSMLAGESLNTAGL